jgi:HEAT repeat protein
MSGGMEMKAKKDLLVIAAMAVTVALAACSKDKNKSSGADPNSMNGPVTEQAFSEKYQFELNGCNTGKHEFSSDSQADVTKQLCEALQNEELNKSCAQPLRKNFFDKKCPSVSWSPVYPKPANPAEPSEPAPVQQDRDEAKEREIREVLKYALVDSFEVKEDLAADLTTFANTLSEDMKSCGFSYVGPKCTNYHAFAGTYEGTLFDPNGESIFMTDLRFDGIDSNILFAFKMKDENGLSSEEMKIYIKVQEKAAAQSIKDYLASANVQLISTVKIAQDFMATAKDRVQSPNTLKELYHMAHQLNEINTRSSSPDASLSSLLVKSFIDNKALFVDGSEDYQYRAYSLAGSLGANDAQKVEIAEEMMKSSDDGIKQFAAVQILLIDSSRIELKPIVVSALQNKRWDVRKNAITALSNTTLSVAEQNKIIEMIGDTDNDVRKEAIRVVDQMALSDEHFATLQNLSNSGNWAVRNESARLAGKVDGDASTIHLISKMGDTDNDVRSQIFQQLDARTMHVGLVSSLETQMSSNNWAVRKDAATLLGKIKEVESTKVLIKKMSDSDNDVRKEIVGILNQDDRTIDGRVLGDLSSKAGDGNWAVRKDVALLIGKISGDDASKKLIEMLSDTDNDVRKAVNESLASRNMNSNLVGSLSGQLSNNNWAVRKDAATYLGKINHASSLAALNTRLAVETDNDVKAEITKSIAAISN